MNVGNSGVGPGGESPALAGHDAAPPWRPLRALARHRWWAGMTGVAIAVLVLVGGTYWPRTYRARGRFDVDVRPLAEASRGGGDLGVTEEKLRREWADVVSAGLQVSVDRLGEGVQQVNLEMRTDDPARAEALVRAVMDRFSLTRRQEVGQQLALARQNLQSALDAASKAERTAKDHLATFANEHPGILPDDPASVVARLERVREKLDQAQQRQRMLDEQAQRLEAYGRKVKAAATQPASAPTAAGTAGETAATDPEVIQLQAQVELLNNQIDEQVGTLRRTEQHPYVADLRGKLAAAQKRLEAAQARAAAGKPPPANIKPPPDHSQDLLLQTVEMQLGQLKLEREQAAAEVNALTAEHAKLQPQVEAVVPLRRQYAGLQEQAAEAQKTAAGAREKLARFAERFPEGREPTVVTGATVVEAGTWPVWPRWDWTLALALALGLGAGMGVAGWVERMDRRIHSVEEFGALAPVKVLGVVDEIRTPRQCRRAQLVRWVVRPVGALVLAGVLAGAAWFSYAAMGRPGHGQGGLMGTGRAVAP